MKRLPLVLGGFFVLAALPLAAANVTGKVAFVTKRGQNPVPAETLVWVEPASGRALRVNPGTFQIVTRNKILVPHVLAIPVGSTVTILDVGQAHLLLWGRSGRAELLRSPRLTRWLASTMLCWTN